MELTWNKVIGGGFALGTAVAGATWSLRADRIEELSTRIDFYEKSGALSLSDTLASIKSANTVIRNNLESISDYHDLEKEISRLLELLKNKEKSISDLNTDLSKAKEESIRTSKEHNSKIEELSKKHSIEVKDLNRIILEKQSIIEDTIPHHEKFTLDKDSSKALFASKIVVGVVEVSRSNVEVTVNNHIETLRAGEYKSIELDNLICKVILTKFEHTDSRFRKGSANFEVTCGPNVPNVNQG